MSLIERMKKRLLVGIPACRNVKVLDHDVFIVSYPRSGNTWIRFLLANLVLRKNIDFINKEQILPDIYKNSNRTLLKIPSPRFLKSHEYFDSRYPKVIYIYRDGRDVAVSYYRWFQKFRFYKGTFDEFLEGFLKGTLDGYGDWAEHINGWMNNCGKIRKGALFLEYQDMRKDTHRELKKVLEFLEVERTNEAIDKAVEGASFQQMASVEKEQENEADELKQSRKDIKFVRKGSSGGWKKMLSREQRELFKEYFGKTLIKLGYEKDNNW